MLLLIQFLFTCSFPQFFCCQMKLTIAGGKIRMTIRRVLNTKWYEHCDNFCRCFAYQIFVLRQYILTGTKRCVHFHRCPFFYLPSIFMGLRCHESHGTHRPMHILTSVPFFFHCIKLPKNEYWHIKGCTSRTRMTHENFFFCAFRFRFFAQPISTSYDMHGSTDKCQKRY